MKNIAIIPARMSSSRFPGKPMEDINGIPMIGHCYFRARLCKSLDQVYVATCDDIIFDYINSIGGKAIMTSKNHERASDRAAEALYKIEKSLQEKFDIVVMLQGDEPMVTPNMINKSLEPFKDKNVEVVNLYSKITNMDEYEDPNEVKVVLDSYNDAIYFSREPIPSSKKGAKNFDIFKQVCVIPFRRKALMDFNDLEETPLEIIESVDMMRIIENGKKVRMVKIEEDSYSVDVKSDLDKVIKLMKTDTLVDSYN
jgi:3-deoxy-manno-octulosonate cytidylyltransferase (CMP-KDO synthetase)